MSAYKVPTDSPESDGTYEWESTTMVLVEVRPGGKTGLGYSYADTATARLVRDLLAGVVEGRDAMAVPGAMAAMVAAVRNLGRPGIASMAISAVDTALWDLKARLLELRPGDAAWGRAATSHRCTAAAGSPRIRPSSSATSSAAGSRRASRGSR